MNSQKFRPYTPSNYSGYADATLGIQITDVKSVQSIASYSGNKFSSKEELEEKRLKLAKNAIKTHQLKKLKGMSLWDILSLSGE